MEQDFDVVIVGGGMVGASLAVALSFTSKRILVVEPSHPGSAAQPSYDERTVALTYSARNIFSAIGVWKQIESAGVQPIYDIHISNRGHFGQAHLCAAHAGTEALGYVVPTRVIGECLWEQIEQAKNITLCCPATVEALTSTDDNCSVVIAQGKKSTTARCRLVVLADGGRSTLARQSGLVPESKSYGHSAVLSIISVDRPHNGRAYERFTRHGPLALLPLGQSGEHESSNDEKNSDRYAVVWSTDNSQVDARLELDDQDFIEALQQEFGDRAGNFFRPTQRKAYPLSNARVESPVNGRVVAIGNAAHTVHPVAGQGFNLGLRDVACLAEIIHDCAVSQLGSAQMMHRYASSRLEDTTRVDKFTHSLIEIFANEYAPLSLARNLVLKAIEYCPPAKRLLLRRTMGLAGNHSRLALGLALKNQASTPTS